MTFRKRLSTLAAVAVATAALPVSGALAQDGSTTTAKTPTTIPAFQIEGAYAFTETFEPRARPYVTVVVKTDVALPRRYDGLIRAGGGIDGTRASVGSVVGKDGSRARHCYLISVKVRDGKIGTHDKSAKIGTKHLITFGVRGTNGKDLEDTTTVTLAKRKVGDRAGKPLGC